MKPTWGIRKLNEYSVDKNTAIIITDSEKDNYYWADIPDGSLLVNDKTGNLSIKLTGESDWVPMGIRKDGTEKLVKDAVINIEYYTIVKFELEHNRFYYHDREEITRIGKIINGKAQFKVGSGLYLPGTNQLEVLINDSVHRNTIDGGLEEINMKYFQIDVDDIRLGSTVTVRYINYERLSELYPFIYTQEQVPWFFEDKDLWINPADNVDVNGLTITPLSYYVKYLDNNEAEVIIFTTKNSRLIASRKMNEYVNKITDKNVNRFKVTRENNNFYINIFSTYPGYKTSFAKVLIKGLISDEDKLTLDVDLTYPNSGMAKISTKTQLGNIITLKRDNRKIYSAQNIGIGFQHNLVCEKQNYDITVTVKNPANGLTKEKVLTIIKKRIILTASISHTTSISGTVVSVETIPNSKVEIVSVNPVTGSTSTVLPETVVDADGRFSSTIPLTNNEGHYKVIVTNDKADNDVEENVDVLLHNARTPLSVHIVDAYDGLDESLKARKGISIQAESGSTITIKDQDNNVIFTHVPSNLSVESAQYNVPLFYAPDTKTFTIEAIKTNKVPESKTITIQGYEKIDAPIVFDVKNPTFDEVPFLGSISYPCFKVQAGSTVVAYDENNNLVKTYSQKDSFTFTASLLTFDSSNAAFYAIKQKNNDIIIRFVCTHPLYKTVEITKNFVGKHLPEYQFKLLNTYVINPYADMYNSDVYQVLDLEIYKTDENGDKSILTINSNPNIVNNLVLSYGDTNARLAKYTDSDLLEKINGSKTSYLEFYGTDDLSNKETLTVLPKINDYLSNAYESNHMSYYFIFKVDNFDNVLHDRNINIKVNNKPTLDINVPTTILHWKNLENSIYNDLTNKSTVENDYSLVKSSNYDIYNLIDKNIFSINKNIKYVHPNLIKFIVLKHNSSPHAKLEPLFNKMKQAGYIDNPEKRTDQFYGSDSVYYVDGNKLFDIYFKYLFFTSDIILFPSIFSYLYVASFFADSGFYIQDCYFVPRLYLSGNINEENIIAVKINNQKFIDNFYKIFDELNIKRNQSYKTDLESFSSCNLIINFKGKIIPSFFLGNYYNNGIRNVIIANNVEEVKDNGLCCNLNSKAFLDYSKIKKFNNMSFVNPVVGQQIQVKNINKNNNEILIKLSDETYVDNNNVYKLSDLVGASNFLLFKIIVNKLLTKKVSEYKKALNFFQVRAFL